MTVEPVVRALIPTIAELPDAVHRVDVHRDWKRWAPGDERLGLVRHDLATDTRRRVPGTGA
ncbi:hypothetical protein [Streptodolium elevatio]